MGRRGATSPCPVLEADVAEGGDVFAEGVFEAHLAFFDEHHDADRGHGPGHAADPEERILAHGALAADIRQAESLDGDEAVRADHRGDGAGDLIRVHETLQREGGDGVLFVRHGLGPIAAGHQQQADT